MSNTTAAKKADEDDVLRKNQEKLDELLNKAKEGDEAATQELFSNSLFLAQILLSARRAIKALNKMGMGLEPQEITQEALFRAWTRIKKYRRDATFKTFVDGIIHNIILEAWREGTLRRGEVSFDDMENFEELYPAPSFDELSLLEEEFRATLDESQKQLLDCLLDDKTPQEIYIELHFDRNKKHREIKRLGQRLTKFLRGE